MSKQDLLDKIDQWEADPDDLENCDLLCQVTDALGLPNGEYSAEYLRQQVEARDWADKIQ